MTTRSDPQARKRTLLSNLERALLDALAESPEVHRTLWHLQKAGYTLRLSIDCQESEAAGVANPSVAFRIDAEDLRFLRSIGVDPTRRARTRKRS